METKTTSQNQSIFWYLYKGVVLTKNNLARRQWQGDRKCCFYSSDESIQHLFFDYHFAKFVWRIVHVSFNSIPPTNVHNLFIGWLDGINRKMKSKILVVQVHFVGRYG